MRNSTGKSLGCKKVRFVNGYKICNGAYLRNADLKWVDLFEAQLRRADLRKADLHKTNLCGADLSITKQT
ncbi:MAG: pentapeptide repeat-containing protein [Deltaproteobacteria bacterium]|nr:pentapeptide repeat-containing protein [Deltaproteobacteria bacterium]